MVADSSAFAIAQNATTPTLTFTLRDSAGAAINLTGNTVVFNLRSLAGAIVGGGACVLDPDQMTHPGKVTRTFTAGDTATVGAYFGTFAISGPLAQTVPADPSQALLISVYAATYPWTTTLGALRRALAPRLGYYYGTTLTTPQVAPLDQLVLPELITSDDTDEMLGRYVLRPSQTGTDRVRQITAFDPATGTVTLNSAYAVAATTTIEIHSLHPDQQILAAIRAGLEHCYLVDQSDVTILSTTGDVNLTQYLPWILTPEQVYRIGWQQTVDQVPTPLRSWDLAQSGNSVYLRRSVGAWTAGTLVVTSRRPHSTLVNNHLQMAGPTLEADVLGVPVNYAIPWAHSLAWSLFPELLQPQAQIGLGLTRQQVADEATRASATFFHPPQPIVMPAPMRRVGGRWPSVVINGPEADDLL